MRKDGFKFVYRTAALLLAAALLTAGCGGSGRADTEDSAEAYQWLDDYEPVSREPLTLTRWETDSLEDLETTTDYIQISPPTFPVEETDDGSGAPIPNARFYRLKIIQ